MVLSIISLDSFRCIVDTGSLVIAPWWFQSLRIGDRMLLELLLLVRPLLYGTV